MNEEIYNGIYDLIHCRENTNLNKNPTNFIADIEYECTESFTERDVAVVLLWVMIPQYQLIMKVEMLRIIMELFIKIHKKLFLINLVDSSQFVALEKHMKK